MPCKADILKMDLQSHKSQKKEKSLLDPGLQRQRRLLELSLFGLSLTYA